MSFTEKMQIATLILEYAKVAFGYSVTIPILIAVLCYLFRDQIGKALDALREITFPGGSAKLEKRREQREIETYSVEVERTGATTENALDHLTAEQQDAIKAIISLFGLAARILPLIPKADRRRFIEESTGALPPAFVVYRHALFYLADKAPEVHALNARDVVIRPEAGGFQIRGGDVTFRHERKDDDTPDDPILPVPKV